MTTKTALKLTALFGMTMATFLTGCSTKATSTPAPQYVPSFTVEVLPEHVACERQGYNGQTVNTTCIQVRYNGSTEPMVLKGDIQGFSAKAGTSYVLDVRQLPVERKNHETLQGLWILNKIVSQQ